MITKPKTKRILILMATAGGGHKSAAQSIAESLSAKYGSQAKIEILDLLEHVPKPLDRSSEIYQLMIKAPPVWEGSYRLADGIRRSKIINSSLARYLRRSMDQLIEKHPADVIVSTYHFANTPILETLQRLGRQTPFLTVVTDLVTAPPVWFDPRTTICITPTTAAADLAIRCGVEPDKIKALGLPVSTRFSPDKTPKTRLKSQLGWDASKPAVIVIAGGEGIGALDQIAENLSTLDATVVVITGKNSLGFHKLSTDHPPNAKIYAFVNNLDEFMKAADLIITKAGPGTIVEALNSHLPLILYAKLSGQEDGNVSFVVDNHAGLWEPNISRLSELVNQLLSHPNRLSQMSEAASKIAQPDASQAIASEIGQAAGLPPAGA